MGKIEFNHLHVHTVHSLLDGYTHVRDLVKTVKGYDMKTVAITDHGNMAGVPSLWKEAVEAGIKPVAGVEAYVCEDRLKMDGGKSEKAPYYHLTLLAQNLEGYKNLCRLNTLAHREGYKRKPRLDLELLQRHNKGLVCMSGCVGGWSQQHIIKNEIEAAIKVIGDFKSVFTDRFFLEMQWTGEDDQKTVNKAYIDFSKKFKLPLVLTGDSHYTCRNDSDDHDTLLCVGLHKKKSMPKGEPGDKNARIKFVPHQYYIKSPDEMAKLGLPMESLKNTLKIASMCENYALPVAGGVPAPEDAHQRLADLAWDGFYEKFQNPTEAHVNRLAHELDTVDSLNYSGYFLIIHRIIEWARAQGMFMGWGRGSSAGSLLAYVLKITGINPLMHGLYFERFLNKARREPPDIDLDFTDEDRPKVVEFMKTEWGADKVAHVGTYSTLGPKALIQDVSDVLDSPVHSVRAAMSVLPHDPTTKIKDLLENEVITESLKQSLGPKMIDLMRKFDSIPRYASVHAAGIIVDKNSVFDSLPFMGKNGNGEATQYQYEDLHELGYEKFDILGVRTLRVIRDTCNMVGLDAHEIPLDDHNTYGILCAGATVGIFQLEGYGYRKFVMEFKPKNFNDIMMTNALYRPGPMQGGQGLGVINDRRFGGFKWEYMHPSLEPILKNTYGVMVFQEQVMAVVQILAGWDLEQADILRKAVSKKKIDDIKKLREEFVKDCVGRGHTNKFAQEAYSQIEFFSRYGWNKAHAAAYGMITYICAYLKANHTSAYMTALLNSEVGDHEKQGRILKDTRSMLVQVYRPDINRSGIYSALVLGANGPAIQLGLRTIKGLGQQSSQWIVDERSHGAYASVTEFRRRVPPRAINKVVMECLVKAGAFKGIPNSQPDESEMYVLPF